jgi:hypothetical protein
LDMGHTLRGDSTLQDREREGNQKLEYGWCVHCRGANLVILNWQRPLWEGDFEISEEIWYRWTSLGCKTHIQGNSRRNLPV